MVGKQNPGLPDGLRVDAKGNLFATGPGGVHVYAPDGTLLGRIETGQATANCAFGGDGSDLYITADMFIVRVKTKTKGARTLKIATWNVNGIARPPGPARGVAGARHSRTCCACRRSRRRRRNSACSPTSTGYQCYWHGDKGYSGVALLVSERVAPDCPEFVVPPFDFEARIVTVRLPELAVASVYVPERRQGLRGQAALPRRSRGVRRQPCPRRHRRSCSAAT